jgi:hypothetical protein
MMISTTIKPAQSIMNRLQGNWQAKANPTFSSHSRKLATVEVLAQWWGRQFWQGYIIRLERRAIVCLVPMLGGAGVSFSTKQRASRILARMATGKYDKHHGMVEEVQGERELRFWLPWRTVRVSLIRMKLGPI